MMGLSALEMLVSLAFGYLCGTIPFGLILTKSAGLGDIRTIGSGNIGTDVSEGEGAETIQTLRMVAVAGIDPESDG